VWSNLGDRGSTYEVGDRVADDIPLVEIEDECLKVKAAESNGALHILLSWKCTHCGLSNFAKVILRDGHVRCIEAMELNPGTLATLHYIAETVVDMLETLIGEPLYSESGLRSDWLTALRHALESGKRW
jgi:hypothetical protein